jgi:hypothetical protein
VGAITPCGQCRACLSGQLSQCGHGEGFEALGGWRFGNTINGAQAEYLLVPYAQANLAKVPDELSDEQVVLLADRVATFGDSWTFIIIFAAILLSWVLLNTLILARHSASFDPYPYILLDGGSHQGECMTTIVPMHEKT